MKEHMTGDAVHILHLEDDPADAELVQRTLESAAMDCRITCARTHDEFDKALSMGGYDVILADYRLPDYDGVSALRLAQERRPDVPFIFVSGTMGEDAAIEGLTEGATDYVLKHRLSRLVPAVKRALHEAENRRERERAEKALRQAEEKYRHIFEYAAEGIFQSTPEGRYITVNPALAEMHGYDSPEEMVAGITSIERQVYVRPEDCREFRRCLNEKGQVKGFEIDMYRKDGTTCSVSVSARAVRDTDGAVLYYDGTSVDVTERRKSEERLFQTTKRWMRTFDAVPDLIAILDNDFRIVQVNRAMASRLGSTPEECTGQLCYAVVDGTEGPPPFCPHVRTLEDCRDHVAEVSSERLGGDFIVSTSPLYDSAGQMIGSVHVARDITERKRAEEEKKRLEIKLHQAQKMEAIGTLAGGIAHDFNNLLTVITGFGSLLKMRMDEADPSGIYVDEIISASEKAATLTHGLLAFSRQQPIHAIPLRINDLIKATERLLKRLITEDIILKISLAPDDIVVVADATHIDQILFNLASNAGDAMPKGGVLTIETGLVELDSGFVESHGFGEPGRYALLSISDTGVGMDEKTKALIFDPFFTTKEVGKGTGLGLSTVYGIVKQHNGYITVYSEPNIGTAFHIYLPAVAATAKEKQLLVAPVKRGRETILVAEDNPGVRSLITRILTQYGYRIVEASDGEEAISKFKEEPNIDLLILDSVMPKKGGQEAYDEISRIRPDIKVLFTSGYTRDVILQKGMEGKEFDLILKPLSPKSLLEKIREVLDRCDS